MFAFILSKVCNAIDGDHPLYWYGHVFYDRLKAYDYLLDRLIRAKKRGTGESFLRKVKNCIKED